jgi:hypothetical protein
MTVVKANQAAIQANKQLIKGREFSSAPSVDNIDESALVRKIDRRLMPILFLIYVAAFLDR